MCQWSVERFVCVQIRCCFAVVAAAALPGWEGGDVEKCEERLLPTRKPSRPRHVTPRRSNPSEEDTEETAAADVAWLSAVCFQRVTVLVNLTIFEEATAPRVGKKSQVTQRENEQKFKGSSKFFKCPIWNVIVTISAIHEGAFILLLFVCGYTTLKT